MTYNPDCANCGHPFSAHSSALIPGQFVTCGMVINKSMRCGCTNYQPKEEKEKAHA